MTHMPLSRLCGLALRQLLRDIRASEVRVLFFALLVAVAASTAIGYFGARLNGAMQLRASEFLGADLVLQGSAPARDQQIEAGKALGLRHAQVVEFTSVAGLPARRPLVIGHADDSGLGLLPGVIRRFKDQPDLKVPQMGWNQVRQQQKDCPLFANLPDEAFVYFVHSYYAEAGGEAVAGTTTYGIEYTSMVWRDNMMAVQFHPEKSQKVGLTMLENFADWAYERTAAR